MNISIFNLFISNSYVYILLLILNVLHAYVKCNDVKQELERHFGIEGKDLDEVSNLLLQMKLLAHGQIFGDRTFSRDSAADSKKDISISIEQPKTTSKLTPYLFEGDILLSSKQAGMILQSISSKPVKKTNRNVQSKSSKNQRQRRSFSSDIEAKWTQFPIKYRFHESLEFLQISQIVEAIKFWEKQTCIRFLSDNSADGDFIEFFKGEGCYSVVGRFGGQQGISIGEGCERIGTIEHEIGHSLGLWHEQSRPDASKYVEILKNYILPSYVSEFLQRDEDEVNTLGVPYDYGSIMHYGSTAFSADQKSKTLLTRDPFYQSTIGQREILSFYDVKVINEAYCKDKCKSKNICKNGGYPHPSNCMTCLCPEGLSGTYCEMNEPHLGAECGSMHEAKDDWQFIESPGYPDPGYTAGEKCSWVIQAPKDERIELEFIEDYGMFCASTCVDYVELKISLDMGNTGYRFCCYEKPNKPIVSRKNQAVIIFRSTVGEDTGFKLRFRKTKNEASVIPTIRPLTTTKPPTTIAGENIWGKWGEWSECSRPCGGCGIKSRVRTCSTAECQGKSQEFSACNLNACPVDPKCSKIKSLKRLCVDSRVCTHLSDAISSCSQPSCCPPFYKVGDRCQGDEPVLSSFVSDDSSK